MNTFQFYTIKFLPMVSIQKMSWILQIPDDFSDML